jgi:hypothetical protein
MSRTVHVAMSIAAASQANIPPLPIQTGNRASAATSGAWDEVSGFFATRDIYPIDTAV